MALGRDCQERSQTVFEENEANPNHKKVKAESQMKTQKSEDSKKGEKERMYKVLRECMSTAQEWNVKK
jgi:hypothetical protein